MTRARANLAPKLVAAGIARAACINPSNPSGGEKLDRSTFSLPQHLFCIRQMSWITLDLAHARRPLSFYTFSCDVLPSLLCYYATAVLVLTPRTRYIRLALLPITVWLSFRAFTCIDLAAGYPQYETLAYLNQAFTVMLATLVLRGIVWAIPQHPYTRKRPSTSKYMDGADLCFNLRGIGWSWSHGVKLPIETRNTSSVPSFLLSTATSIACNSFLFDLCHSVVQYIGRETFASGAGGTIFDPSLALLPRLARALIITLLTGGTICYAMQMDYHLLTCAGLLILRQSPEVWPPLFAHPWLATSLNQFWSYRWHQLFRHNFLSFGGRPAFYITGSRICGVLGAFFASGIMHYVAMGGMGQGSNFTAVVGFFVMMGVGVVLEHSWRRVTGHRVGGMVGWTWTYAWLLCWGTFIVDAWCVKGLAVSQFLPDGWRPALFLLGWLNK